MINLKGVLIGRSEFWKLRDKLRGVMSQQVSEMMAFSCIEKVQTALEIYNQLDFILVDAAEVSGEGKEGMLQKLREKFPSAYLAVIVDGEISGKALKQLKKRAMQYGARAFSPTVNAKVLAKQLVG